jgi:putative transferase (TIGR04331 family)
MSMPRAQIWNLIRTSGLRAGPIAVQNKWFFDMPEPEFDQRRNELAALTASDEFESNFFRTLPQNLPTIYLEGFNQAQCETLRNYKEYPPVLCSATGWLFNEQFKFFAAESEEKGSRLVAVQHGGGDGEYRFAPIELHMCRLSETFMVWGWKDQDEAALKNLPSPRISSFISDCSETGRQQKEGPVLFIATSHLRYLYRFHSCPVGGQLEDYWDWQLRFLASAPVKLRKVVLYRAYHTDYGWCARQRISDRFPEVQSDDSPSIDQRIRESRLIVIDHLSTSLLESFTANVPTVLYWNPARWEVREEAEADFQKLRDAGILWDSPEEAASHVSAVFDEPWEWWGQEAVQSARSSFLEGHGLGRKDWTRHWVKSLEAEFALSQVPQSAGA